MSGCHDDPFQLHVVDSNDATSEWISGTEVPKIDKVSASPDASTSARWAAMYASDEWDPTNWIRSQAAVFTRRRADVTSTQVNFNLRSSFFSSVMVGPTARSRVDTLLVD